MARMLNKAGKTPWCGRACCPLMVTGRIKRKQEKRAWRKEVWA